MSTPLELVVAIVQSFVDHPDQVVGRWLELPDGGTVELKVSPEDRGKVIGKGGRNIQSLRRLVAGLCGEENKRIGVELERS